MVNRLINKILLKIRIEVSYFKKRISGKVIKDENISKIYIKKFLHGKPVIIDAGAHIGSDSIEMCRFFDNPQIHAFEPVPSIFNSLKHNVRKYKNIKTYQVALSNTTGQQELNISSGGSDASSSLLKPQAHLVDHPEVFFNDIINVETITLDEWAKNNHISKVDFLWLDMQGFELEVLKASQIIFPTISVVHMEVSTKNTYEKAPTYPEIRIWMESKGFKVVKEAIPHGWDMGNVLFVKST